MCELPEENAGKVLNFCVPVDPVVAGSSPVGLARTESRKLLDNRHLRIFRELPVEFVCNPRGLAHQFN